MITQLLLAGFFMAMGLGMVINYKNSLIVVARVRNLITPIYGKRERTFRDTLEGVYSDKFSYIDYRLYGLCFFTIGMIIFDGALRNMHTSFTDFFTQVFFYMEMALSLFVGLILLWVFILTRFRGTTAYVKSKYAKHKDKKKANVESL